MLDHWAEIGREQHAALHLAWLIGRSEGDAFRADSQRRCTARGVGTGQGDHGVAAAETIGGDGPGEQIAVADKSGHEGRGRALIQILLPPHLLHPPGLHHHQPIGHRHGLLLVMGDHDGGEVAVALQQPDFAPDLLTQLGIQIGQRLIEQQQPRMDGQGPGDGHTLLLPAGELARQAPSQRLQLHQPQHLRHPRLTFGAGETPHLQPEGDVARHAEMREQRIVLKHHAHIAQIRRQMADALTFQRDLARRCVHKPRDHAQCRGFAAAGRTEQHDHLALFNLQRHAIGRQGLAIAPGQAIKPEIAHDSTCPMRTKRSSSISPAPTTTICATATAATSGSIW